MNFDLISDLNLESWSHNIKWDGLGTSLLSVVAGDISYDVDQTLWELKKISAAYRQTIYIEGDLEHSHPGWTSEEVHRYLKNKISKIPNCIYLHDNVVIFEDQAFIGANLWWIPQLNEQNKWDSFINTVKHHKIDLEYLKASVFRMQKADDIKKICLISHTVPNLELLPYDQENLKAGSHVSEEILDLDVNNKIKTWCFGHVPQKIDFTMSEVRYISNPRGTPDNSSNVSYFPLRVEL